MAREVARAPSCHATAMSRVPDVVYNLWVRMWRERDTEAGGWEWRGRVRDAVTHEDRSFREMQGLVEVIEELTKELPDDPDGNPS